MSVPGKEKHTVELVLVRLRLPRLRSAQTPENIVEFENNTLILWSWRS